jgi:hypothetical protein
LHPEILDVARWSVRIRGVYRWWLRVIDIACATEIRGIEAIMQVVKRMIGHRILNIVLNVRRRRWSR